jgi:hypothetical protein
MQPVKIKLLTQPKITEIKMGHIQIYQKVENLQNYSRASN